VRARSPLLPIFLIVLVDVCGFAMVIPLLARYAETFGASPLVATLLSSCYGACSLVSSPLLGRLSDRHGRRPLLVVSQLGTLAGFLVLASADSLALVFVGRILDGASAGNVSIAQAYVSDHTAPADRARAFGVLGTAFSLGFVIGPALSAQLAPLGLHAPFLAAAGLSAASIACTLVFLPPEARPASTGAPRARVLEGRAYADLIGRPGLAPLFLLFFLFQLGFFGYQHNFLLFAERRFVRGGRPWGPTEVGWVLTYAGLLGVILQSSLIGRMVRRFGEPRLVIAGFTANAIAYATVGVTHALPLLLAVVTATAFGNGVLRPVLTSRISQAVGRDQQGVALGVSHALRSLGMMIAPPLGGALMDHAWLVPWALGCASISATGLAVAIVQGAGSGRGGSGGSGSSPSARTAARGSSAASSSGAGAGADARPSAAADRRGGPSVT